ncbi:MAG: hypothetical protein KatS3mg131_0880 [Candidatus Tectimicrobiota bacterium]|nr:MAG: hypothetical protein KatS3mg131_0880 [Candidatus Tectomicrobia bacterium]
MRARYRSLAPLVSWAQLPRPLDWEALFARQAPLEVELGFGNGEFLVRQAQARPAHNFVGIEREWASVQRGLRRIAQAGVDNVRLLLVEARVALERLFAPQSIARLYALFPCPWPKARHAKHRLFSHPFLCLLNSRLAPEGEVLLVTDHRPYLEWVLEQVPDSGFACQWRCVPPCYRTKYERKWQAQGQEQFYELLLRKAHHHAIPVPEEVAVQIHRVSHFDPERFQPADAPRHHHRGFQRVPLRSQAPARHGAGAGGRGGPDAGPLDRHPPRRHALVYQAGTRLQHDSHRRGAASPGPGARGGTALGHGSRALQPRPRSTGGSAMTAGATQQLATFVATTPLSDLPAATLERAAYFLLDYLGVALRGSCTDSSATARACVQTLAPGPATLIGCDQGALAPFAALVNGVSAHSLELDDTHQEGSIHLGAPIFSALIAASELQPASGRDFLAAAVLGYEVAARLAMAVTPTAHYRQGFHPTGTCGTFGAAAAVARLWGLDASQTAYALGIAGSQTAGSMAFLADGAWTKRLHPGWAAHSGLLAAALARQGYRGPTAILEGRDGFLQAYSTAPQPQRLTEALGASFAILATAVKPHACCRYMQAPIDALLELVQRYDLAPSQVAHVTLGILDTAFPIIGEPAEVKYAPRSVVDAQFSMPFGAAVALLYRRASLAEFTPEVIASPAVRELMQKVTLVRDPELDQRFPRQWPAWATIELTDGRKVSASVTYPKGDPQNPLTWEELRAKYFDLGSAVLPRARLETLAQQVQALDTVAEVAPLWRLLRPHAA